ncbi:hypothetical protein [Rhizobium sp.]
MEIAAGKREAGMNVKVSIEISARTFDRAEELVRSGAYGSLSEVFEVGIDRIELPQDEEPTEEQIVSVRSMASELRRRMASPPDNWLDEEEFDRELNKIFAYADEQIKAGR